MAMTQFDKERQRQMAINQTQKLMQAGISAPVIPKVKPAGPKDLQGTEFKVGQRVARAATIGNSPTVKVCKVTDINGPCVYLDGSRQAVKYPNRLLILKD